MAPAAANPDPDTVVFAPEPARAMVGLAPVGDLSAGEAGLLVTSPLTVEGTGQTLTRAAATAMRLVTVAKSGDLPCGT